MIDVGDKFEFIIAAYLVVIIAMGLLSLFIFKRHRHQRKRVEMLEQSGIKRAGAPIVQTLKVG